MTKILKQFSKNGKWYKLRRSYGKYEVSVIKENNSPRMALLEQRRRFADKNRAIEYFLELKN